jgi:hypothetical protein
MDTGNARIREGRMSEIIQQIVAEQQPEASYFVEDDGLRTGYLVVNFDDPAKLPAYAEPWFLALDARVQFHPAMRAEDLARADIAGAVERYG